MTEQPTSPSATPSEPDDSETYMQKCHDMLYVVYGLCFVCSLLIFIVATHAKEWFK